LDILTKKLNLDTVQRFADIMQQSKEDVLLDSLSLQEETQRKLIQTNWIERTGKTIYK
jgi:hypothetical protein